MTYYSPSQSTYYTGAGEPEFEWAARAQDRHKAEASFFDRTSMGGAGYERNIMAGRAEADAAAQAEQVRIAARERTAAASRMEKMQRTQRARSLAGQKAATEQARGDLNPWRKAGTDALGQLQTKIAAGPGEFKESPGYQFRLAEGQKAIERSAAARGGVLSGAAVKAGMRHGQDFATKDYDNFLRRYYDSMAPLERMSEQGRSTAGQMGGFSMQGASQEAGIRQAGTNQMAAATQYGGEAQAEGTMGAANVIAAQQAAATERDYGYAAWKAGEDF